MNTKWNLQKVVRKVEKNFCNNKEPMTSHILIKGNKIFATNYNVDIVVECPVKFGGKGVAIRPKFLPKKFDSFSVDEDGMLHCDIALIKTTSEENYPAEPARVFGEYLLHSRSAEQILGTITKGQVQDLRGFVSRDPFRKNIGGVYFEDHKLIAIDGYKMFVLHNTQTARRTIMVNEYVETKETNSVGKEVWVSKSTGNKIPKQTATIVPVEFLDVAASFMDYTEQPFTVHEFSNGILYTRILLEGDYKVNIFGKAIKEECIDYELVLQPALERSKTTDFKISFRTMQEIAKAPYGLKSKKKRIIEFQNKKVTYKCDELSWEIECKTECPRRLAFLVENFLQLRKYVDWSVSIGEINDQSVVFSSHNATCIMMPCDDWTEE
jgi:hypothetical protein